MPEESQQKLEHYLSLLRKWQRSINLVGPDTLDDAWRRHIEDSTQLADMIPAGAIVFDLGSGAGFPGLALAMIRPDLDVTLVESDTKKCTFLSTVSRETKTPVHILNQRIESLESDLIPVIITARALAPLDKLLTYCQPWAKINPALEMLFLKGRRAEEELAAARTLYDFNATLYPSLTDSEGRIVRISNLIIKTGD